MRDIQAEWMAAMRAGDWDRAWAVNDAVLAARDPDSRDDPRLPYHLRWVWDGRPFEQRDVLVRCYHGLGDTLQFARYLAPLRARAASVTLEAQPALVPLLQGLAGIDRLVPFAVAAPLPPAACDFEIMELAHALRLPPRAVPPAALRVEAATEPGDAIGLCWTGGDWDAERSVPAPLLEPLCHGRRIVSLQPGATPLPVINPNGCPGALHETAALVAGLGLVITIDTMIAHLAATLGRPTWLLLKRDADWRWMEGREDSPWYPSMRLFRQPRPGDWPSVIASVAAALREREASHGPVRAAG
ncbi:MAG: hypothetical protein J0H67_10645 [Rhodospirillales bacterium]|nr:hypothetical protein [Rhodospirillales bacterium]